MCTFLLSTLALHGKGGEAHITAASGDIFNITITASGHAFADYIFDPHKPNLANNIVVDVFLDRRNRSYGPFQQQ